MARTGFLALVGDGRPDAAQAVAEIADQLFVERGWRPLASIGDCRVWSTGCIGLPVHHLPEGRGVVLGDLFDHPDASAVSAAKHGSGDAHGSPAEIAARLSRRHWGRYIALILGKEGWSVFRDPSGQFDALIWRRDPGLTVIASDISALPRALTPHRLAMNWERIAAFLAAPAASTTEPLFDGISAVGPGDLLPLRAGSRPHAVWRPSQFLKPMESAESAAALLVPRVDAAVAALVTRHDRALFELSGGLDSAILAGSLGALGQTDRVSQWIHWADERGEADELRYARAVTEMLGVPLRIVPQPVVPIEPSELAELAPSFWPAMSGADITRDRDETERLRATGASAIISGQGGDAVFFQMRSAQVMADALRLHGLRTLASPLLPAVARRTQQSIWTVLAEVHRGGPKAPPFGASLISPWLRAAARGHAHAWVLDPDAQVALPGKRIQIRTLANCHLFHGQSRRRAAAELIYPLLAQPVVELCLRTPSPVLAGAPHDRRFARQVFAGRIPAMVRERTTKGALNAYFSRLVMASRESLAPFLRQGCLVEAGLLNPAALEKVFDPNQLIQGGFPTEVLWAASVEAWVRHWQTRVPDSAAAPRWRPGC